MADLPEDLPESSDPSDFTEEQLEALLEVDMKELPKHLRIAAAKFKSQRMRAKMEERKAEEEDEEESEEAQAEAAALEFADVRRARRQLGDALDGVAMQHRVPYLVARPDRVRDVLEFCKRGLGYGHLACLTAADYQDRLEVVYNLVSYETNRDLAVKARLDRDDPVVPSATPLWNGANWFEREVWDLFGVRFEGHPNLKRIMMPEGWEGHPLRKDYDLAQEQYIAMDEVGDDVVSKRAEEGW